MTANTQRLFSTSYRLADANPCGDDHHDIDRIMKITYPDGSEREVGYDSKGQPCHIVDPEGTTLCRQTDGTWKTCAGESFAGTVAVVSPQCRDGLPGTIIITRRDRSYVVSEKAARRSATGPARGP